MSGQHSETRVDPAPGSARIDTSVAHPARRYDYFLGGKDNFAADRESGDQIIEVLPTARTGALENRRFLRRAVTHLAAHAGIRQFLDIGTGIPTSPNTHEIAQAIAPESRVVYVDNDPIVLAHARALLTSTPQGATAYLDADLRRPGDILNHPDLHRTIDLSQPVALMLIAVLHFIPDSDDPRGLVEPLVRALPPGSYLAMSHVSYDYLAREEIDRLDGIVRTAGFCPRPGTEFASYFGASELLEPGIVSVSEWRAQHEPAPRPTPAEVCCLGGLARLS